MMDSKTALDLFLHKLSKNIELADFGKEAIRDVWNENITTNPHKTLFNKFWMCLDSRFARALDLSCFEYDFKKAWDIVCNLSTKSQTKQRKTVKKSRTKSDETLDIINIII